MSSCVGAVPTTNCSIALDPIAQISLSIHDTCSHCGYSNPNDFYTNDSSVLCSANASALLCSCATDTEYCACTNGNYYGGLIAEQYGQLWASLFRDNRETSDSNNGTVLIDSLMNITSSNALNVNGANCSGEVIEEDTISMYCLVCGVCERTTAQDYFNGTRVEMCDSVLDYVCNCMNHPSDCYCAYCPSFYLASYVFPTNAPTDVPTDVPTNAPTDVPTNVPSPSSSSNGYADATSGSEELSTLERVIEYVSGGSLLGSIAAIIYYLAMYMRKRRSTPIQGESNHPIIQLKHVTEVTPVAYHM